MKLLLPLLLALLFISGNAFSQANSVVLKNGGGTTLSQHASIMEAYNVIPGTLTQAYVIEIQTAYTGASETFPITLTARTGGSASNTITIRPAAGNTGETISGLSTTGIFILNDADYIIFDGRPGGTGSTPDLKIENTATTGVNSNTIELNNGSSNNIIRYCHLLNASQNASGPRTIEIAGGTAGNSDNTIHNCKIEGGRSGIGFDGTAGLPNNNTVIRLCEIFNFGYAGIWIFANSSNIDIDSCTIYQTTGINNTLNTGINIGGSSSGIINIRRNKIYDIQSTSTSTANSARGIWFQTSGSAGSTYNISNNFISLPLSNNNATNTFGIDINGANAFNVNVHYNTVRIGGTQTGGSGFVSAGIRYNSAGAVLNAQNNICINKRAGGNGNTGAAYITTAGTHTINYNCYYAEGAGSSNAVWGATGYNVLADYKAAATPYETNTIFKDVNFVSVTDLHLTGASVGDTSLKGTPIAGITTDIDGQLRHAIAPYKGADEGSIVLAIGNQNNNAEVYSLSQNYPNPFNPATTINFAIPRSGIVVLQVYDASGRQIKTLINGELQKGVYNVTFNAEKLSSGVYFYTLKADGFTETKKMLLVK
jgi:hypothetical protein